MLPKIAGLKAAVKTVLESHKGDVDTLTICKEIKTKGLVEITQEQEEITYGRPNYYHSVRRIPTELVRSGDLERLSKGRYKSKSVPRDNRK